jgi:hypothetical protein
MPMLNIFTQSLVARLRSIRNSSVATAFGWATLMMTVRVRPFGLVQLVQLFAVDLLLLFITARRRDDKSTIAVKPTYGNELCLLVSSLMEPIAIFV